MSQRKREGSLRNHRAPWLGALPILLALLWAEGAQALTAPTFSKAFQPSTIGPGSVSTLRFDITNSDPVDPVDSLAFTDNLPAGVTIATPAAATSTCGGMLSAPNGGTTITFSDGMLATSSSCSLRVNVTSSTVGTHMNVSGDLTSTAGNSGGTEADLTVAADRPGFTKSFSPSSVSFGGRSTLTFTIDNTASASAATALSFVDNLPLGMTVANPANASTDCGTAPVVPTLVAVPGTSTISLGYTGNLAFPAVAAGASCTVDVDVIGGAVGMLGNTSGELSATVGGSSRSSGKAAAVLTVTGGASEPILLTKQFIDDPVAPGGTVTLEFTITNTDRFDTAIDIAFTDDLGAALTGLTFASVASNTCDAAPTGVATSMLSFSGGTLAPGSSCTFRVTSTVPGGATPGTYTNTSSTIAATIGGSAVTGSAASDLLFVVAFPLLTKEFTDDPVGAGGAVTLELTITNTSTASALDSIAFLDELTSFLPFPVSVGLPPTPNPPCGAGSSLALIFLDIDRQALSLTGGSLAASDGSPGGPDTCTFSVTVGIPAGFPGGSYINTTGEITAELTDLGGQMVTGPGASDVLVVAAAPTLSKEFTDDPTAPGGTVTLELTLAHDDLVPSDATAIAFTDNLATVLAGLVASSVLTNTCAGATVDISTPALIDFSGGSLMPGETCTVSVALTVPAGATPGNYANTTSDVTATVSGVTATNNPAVDDLVVAGLTLTKDFIDDPTIPGGTVTLRFTLDNTAGTADATGIFFRDPLDPDVLPGLTPALPPFPDPPCGVGSSLAIVNPPGPTGVALDLTGGSVLAGTSCSFDVTLTVPVGTSDGVYGNTTSSLLATIGGTPVVLNPAFGTLAVDSELLAISKVFTDDPVAPGDPVTLQFDLTNLSATETVTDIAFSDDLSAALPGLVATGALGNDCGGMALVGFPTGMFSYDGGTLLPGESCTITLSLSVPPGPLPGSVFTNTTSAITGVVIEGETPLDVSGAPASDDLLVETLSLSKAFSGPAAATGTVMLSFTIENLDSVNPADSLAFSDNLNAVFAGLMATGLPASGVCGAGSALSGTSFLALTGASLGAGGSCTFDVTLQVPATATAGSFFNATSALSQQGIPVASPASATLVVEPPPGFAKAFAPASIGIGETSALTFTIDNSASVLAASSLAFTDNLPAGVVVASPPNVTDGCGGTVTAVAGAGVITYSGGTVGAGASCQIQVDVTATAKGAFANTTGDLTSSSGNSGTADATLTANPQPAFAKSFAPNPIAAGGISTLSFSIDNTASTVAATGLDFTDNLPAGVVVANPSNGATTCTGGTLTATPGAGVITYTGGTVAAGASCAVTVDVTSSTMGDHLNVSGDLTSSLGSSGTATDTLTVSAAPAFGKSFAPAAIAIGGISTLSFTINNSGGALEATGLDFTDNLPAGVLVANPSNGATTCTGGALTATPGAGVITYTGGTVAAGASCAVTVDVTSSTVGGHLNVSGDLTSSLGTSGTATDTLTVSGGPAFGKLFTPDAIAIGGISTLSFTINNSGGALAATGLDFTDNLPAGVLVANPSNGATTCTGGALTATPGAGVITYTGGTVAAGASCTVTVDVTASAAGAHVNVSGALTSSLGSSATATDTLTVNGPPAFTMGFAPDLILVGGTSTLTFLIDNSASTVAASGLDFAHVLPAGLVVANPANDSTTCGGGLLTAVPGTTAISYSGGSVPALASCTVQVDVDGVMAGVYANTSGDLTSSLGNSGNASASLTVGAVTAVPTLRDWAVMLLAGLLTLIALSHLPHGRRGR